MNWKIALPMYNVSPRLQQGYETLLAVLIDDADIHATLAHPAALGATLDATLADFWRRPDLLVSQTCGYPYVTHLRGQVQLLATPAYDFPGCDGSDYSSVIVTGAGSGIASLEQARGRVAAINEAHSNSGMNALRHAVAPYARNREFFGEIRWSGSHAASLALVAKGEADIAAIDCVTYGYLAQEYPERLRDIRVLGYSAPAPGLPLIAGRLVPPELVARLRAALLQPGARLRAAMAPLRITSFDDLGDAAYDRIGRMALAWNGA